MHPICGILPSPPTSPVGSLVANGYGLYDMAGNVREWCWDCHGEAYYASSRTSDPRGTGDDRQRSPSAIWVRPTPNHTTKKRPHRTVSGTCRARPLTVNTKQSSSPPKHVKPTAETQLNDRRPAFGKSTRRTMATQGGSELGGGDWRIGT
ncbi:MAG TPA: SUMF1/EgtB/PvdO family nonheme iron enzyme [Verrucomicrobiota bacterium]|nr:SUMF1/EgtB/PvdO family nonheme iron enzyme [Verrucomicrobiota bacterium]